jgi:prevent-host-death family protein
MAAYRTQQGRVDDTELRHVHANGKRQRADDCDGERGVRIITLSSTHCRRREVRSPLVSEMCHNVHMKTISIRELHLKTGQWVRHAASRGPVVVTDRGRRVAALQPFDASVTGRPLPNREAAIRKRSKVPVDSAVYQSELREDR